MRSYAVLLVQLARCKFYTVSPFPLHTASTVIICNYLSNLLVNTVRFVIIILHRLSDTKAWMLAVLRCLACSIGQMQILYSKPLPPSHGHECDFMLVSSCLFQKGEPVKNRFKIRMVRKSEPEIGPVRKRTIPLSYEQKRQVQFRPTCWVSTGTRKCISLTLSQYVRETLFSCRSACVFLSLRHKLLNFDLSEPANSFF